MPTQLKDGVMEVKVDELVTSLSAVIPRSNLSRERFIVAHSSKGYSPPWWTDMVAGA